MQEQKKIKVGVIGTGGISSAHLANVARITGLELVGVCDIAPGKAEAVAKQRGGRPYTNFVEMLDKEKPEMVLLLTPQAVRYDPIKACAERAIPMFIEKPPAKNMEEARRTAAVIRQYNLLHSIGFVLRYKAVVTRARELLKGRRVHLSRSRYYAPMILQYEKFPPFYFVNEISGGVLVDQALHPIDLARFIVGSEIEEVYGIGSNLFRPKSEKITTAENLALNLRFANGTIGSHTHTWAYESWMCELEFVSPNARLLVDVFGGKLTGTIEGMSIEYNNNDDGYLAEMEVLADAIRTGDRSKILSTYDDAVKTLGVCVAGNRSIDNRTIEKVELA
ncbi:MAG: Gfo/Idh/MocA family oxidoreductase [Verrucomicrobiae bacterium]|nr:Gfo/Idh/MocA family oxidoreductase [Verrucomicrobiae bacterium]